MNAFLHDRRVQIVLLIVALMAAVFTIVVFISLVFLAGRFTAPSGGGLFATVPSADIIKSHSWEVIKTTHVLFGTQVDRIPGTGTDLPWPEQGYDVDLLFGGISSEVSLYVATSNHGTVKVAGSGESALEMWRRMKDGGQYILVFDNKNQIISAVEAVPVPIK